ncbi:MULTISPECIES: pilus assembly protein TadG-related protein [unclassified Streptomyces]|uniref:pilus assembly protein TadG-related protein n=1 Tax=unclassified Streptomyces TaxID=2593676 RepID=UPI002442FA9A|nr:pilus assembly protein TadG-related protein [Streptomyces sp. DH41]MDG9722114.1 pilus assembly protein TadG-related protein [Streptomyces sp. DH41]
MIPRLSRSDSGQAFPIYITVVAGLLFLAFAYLAVGQAATNRNGAQTAADAAVLAAAQETRDQLAGEWAENVLDPASWQDIFDGVVPGLDDTCWRADQLAAQNDAQIDACAPDGLLGYRVEVTADEPVGDSIVPGTESDYARASAIAVIEPSCTFELPEGDTEADVLPKLTCEDQDWELDPEDLSELPKPQDLFDVHLAD